MSDIDDQNTGMAARIDGLSREQLVQELKKLTNGGLAGARLRNELQELDERDPDEVRDGFQLRFVGKDYARLQASLATETIVVPDTEHNSKPENKGSQNIFITGDNLDALKHLENSYTSQVDVIYIDPPYNTGTDGFVYNDNFRFTDDDLKLKLGLSDIEVERIRNLNGKSSHSAWLTFMYPRLLIAKRLLKDTGIIFISIDDNEQADLKALCDEIFRENNLIGNIPAIMNLKGNQDTFGFADTHDYVLVYARNKVSCVFGKFDVDDEQIDDWQEDEYGLFKKADTLRRTGQDASRERRPKGWFPIFITPTGGIYTTPDDNPLNRNDITLLPVNDEGTELSWTWKKSKINSEPYNLLLTTRANGTYNIYKKQRPGLGDIPTAKPKSVMYKPDYSTSTATTRLKELFGGKKLFDTPKPLPYIKDLLTLGGNKDSLILDFFSGSGTTGHAVMQLNADDGGTRRCIQVQLDELVKGGSVAEQQGYKTIDEIARKRLELAGQKIREEMGSEPQTNFDSGFRHYILAAPSVQTLDKLESFDPSQTTLLPDDMVKPFSANELNVIGGASGTSTLLATWLLDDGYHFDNNYQQIDFDGASAYHADRRLYVIDAGWKTTSTKHLLNQIGNNKLQINTLIVYPYSMGFETLRELKTNIHTNLDDDHKIEIIERY